MHLIDKTGEAIVATYPNTFDNPGRIGRRVLYCLSEYDVRMIQEKRRMAGQAARSGNDHKQGDIVPGIIIKDWYVRGPGRPMHLPDLTDEQMEARATVNIQLFLDGNDSHWVTSMSMFNPEEHFTYEGEAWDGQTGTEPKKIPNPESHWVFV